MGSFIGEEVNEEDEERCLSFKFGNLFRNLGPFLYFTIKADG